MTTQDWTPRREKAFITSVLRGGMRRWPPKWAALKSACIGKSKNLLTNRLAMHYKCNKCKGGFPAKEVQVDHKKPVVDPISGFLSWDIFIERLFCSEDNLQVLCKACHKIKTDKEKAKRKPKKKLNEY